MCALSVGVGLSVGWYLNEQKIVTALFLGSKENAIHVREQGQRPRAKNSS